MILTLEEATDTLSPASEGVSAEDGASTRVWRTPLDKAVTDYGDVIDTEVFFVGSCETGLGAGQVITHKLNRVLPMADPARTGWFTRKVNSVRGVMNRNAPGVPQGFTKAIDGPLGLPQYTVYPIYEFNVTTGPRPYPVVNNAAVTVYTSGENGEALDFFWPDRKTTSKFIYADEWKRFTSEPKDVPQNDYVTAQQGQFYFRCQGGAVPNRYAFTGMPRILLRTSVVSITLFMAPLRWIKSRNSYIRRFRGLVNQLPWLEDPRDGRKKVFGAGSLLYVNYAYEDFCPALASLETAFPAISRICPEIKALPHLCNVTFTFLRTDRLATNPITPAWPGDMVNGHNCLPWFETPNLFYYSTTSGAGFGAANPANWWPMFGSFPVQLLFTDPDAPQPAGFPPPGQGGI
jgi:hypothetical protein